MESITKLFFRPEPDNQASFKSKGHKSCRDTGRKKNGLKNSDFKAVHKGAIDHANQQISSKLIKEIQYSKKRFTKSLNDALMSLISIFDKADQEVSNYSESFENSCNQKLDCFQDSSCDFYKIETIFTKLKADFGLVDSLVDLLINVCASRQSHCKRGKKTPSKEAIKRSKNKKLHPKYVCQADRKLKNEPEAVTKSTMDMKASIKKAINTCSLDLDIYRPSKKHPDKSKGCRRTKGVPSAANIGSFFKKSFNAYKTMDNDTLEMIRASKSKRNNPIRNCSIKYLGSCKPKMKPKTQINKSLEFVNIKKPLCHPLGRCSSNKQVGTCPKIGKNAQKEEALSQSKSKNLQIEQPSQIKSRSKHRRNKSIFTSGQEVSEDQTSQDICKRVLETMQRAQSQPKQAKIQMVDDFSEDIEVLADKLEKEQQKESLRNQFKIPNQHSTAMKSYEEPNKKLAKIDEEAENSF
ncbi:unnamed protein product [Moneuplotes crassus]|uniref:Uncharacterized protein n=1 Tax=Euplotes crassus TaxID=5936 RepID=A0AAD1YA64_EUPCR|nr:unnamed protein product [Moneuplotes crassus]